MNVSCPECNAVFRVDPERIPTGGVLTRCALCRETFEIAAQEEGPEPGERGAAHRATEAEKPLAAPEGEPQDVTDPEPVAQADGEPAPVAEAAPEPAPEAVEPPRKEAPEPRPEPAGAAAPDRPIPPFQPVKPVKPVVAPGGAAAASPFGTADPDAKARRLARALMSDIVMYHPERRDRALREGALRTEFREEITKSWEEYVEQVGSERARRTPHFRDALNDILARGEKVF